MRLSERINSMIHRYREGIMYLLFGVGTTGVNYVVFGIFHHMLEDELAWLANIPSFIAAVAFAYITNKVFVFHSQDWSLRFVLRECMTFLGARIASFIFEELGLILCVKAFHVGTFCFLGIDGIMLSKIVLSFISVIINYFVSKFLIFSH